MQHRILHIPYRLVLVHQRLLPLMLSVTVVELVTLGIDKLVEPDPLESVVIVVDAPVLSDTVYEEFGAALDMFTVIPIVSL